MLEKRHAVKIQLKLHAISCPGVWLCSHGYLEATIKTLGYYLRTGAMEPRFPLLCHDQFTLAGYFKAIGSRQQVHRLLAAEQLEITLWQSGRRLAHFVGKLSDALPGMPDACETSFELLMKATPAFPGIIAPKLSMSSEWSIGERCMRRGSGVSLASDTHSSALLPVHCFGQDDRDECASRATCLHCDDTGHGHGRRRLHQKPVCHTKEHVCQFGGVRSVRPPSRRLSTCSSHASNNTMLSGFSAATPSCCGRTCSAVSSPRAADAATDETADAHQRHCAICQRYRAVFS